MAKRRRGRDKGDRMDSLADLAPENLKSSGAGGGAGNAADSGKRPARAKPVSAEEQASWDERVAQAQEEKAGRGTIAPIAVAGAAVLGVVGVIVWSTLSSGDPVTVDTMPTPVIAADGAGSDVYPANSLEAVRENVRFGFAPAVDLVELGDGTVVLGAGGPEAGEDVFGESYAELTRESFAEGEIPAPRDDTNAGTPVTWSEAYAEYADDTLFMPAVDTDGELDAVLAAAEDADRVDALLVRTADEAFAATVAAAGAVAVFDGDPDDMTHQQLEAAGFEALVVSADDEDLGEWVTSDLGVWVMDATSPMELKDLSDSGVLGAVATDPFAVSASDDDT